MSPNGTAGRNSSVGTGGAGGSAGSGGSGGTGNSYFGGGGGGGGLLTSGTAGANSAGANSGGGGGQAILSGGAGGTGGADPNNGGAGGFGGGGGGGGSDPCCTGAGGGGGGGNIGGGGGSLNNGSNPMNNAGVSTGDGSVTIVYQPLSTTTTLSNPNPSTAGQTVTLTATVTCATTPTGTVTFLDGGQPIGSGTLNGGQATFTTSSLAPGTHTLTASYPGDSSCAASSSNTVTQVVNAASSSVTLSSAPNPASVGQTVTLTATVSCPGNMPTGTVAFFDGGQPIGSAPVNGGQATLNTSGLTVGTHTLTASYSGSASCTASTSNTASQVVTPATTTAIVLPGGVLPPTAGSGSGIVVYGPTGLPGSVVLPPGCTAVTISSPAGTPLAALAALVQPAGSVVGIWRQDAAGRWQAGYLTGGGPVDFSTTAGGTEVYAICVNQPATIASG